MAGAAIGAVLGGFGAYRSAKSAKKEAAKGIDTSEKTTRNPYGPAAPHIQDILDEARRIYDTGGPMDRGLMPYAWQNFMNNPAAPGAGADPTYGGFPPSPAAGGGAGSGGAGSPNLNWRGRDRAEVQAARTARREARNAPQGNSGGSSSQPAPAAPPGGAGGSGGGSGPTFQPQGGPFGYSQGLRDYMMQQFQGGGVGGYQPAMQYIQGLLGGQNQNPYLAQAFSRISGPQQNYFSAFLPK